MNKLAGKIDMSRMANEDAVNLLKRILADKFDI